MPEDEPEENPAPEPKIRFPIALIIWVLAILAANVGMWIWQIEIGATLTVLTVLLILVYLFGDKVRG